MNKIKGVFLVKRDYGNKVSLLNKATNSMNLLDYFEFKEQLPFYFSIDTVNKILDNINCERKVIIDFDNKKAKLIKEKEFDFTKVIPSYLTPSNVENELFNATEEDIYTKFQEL